MRTPSTISSLFAALFFFSSAISSPISAQCDPVRDSLALVAIYHSMNGDDWTNNNNWLIEGQPIETWFGIYVNEEGCVIHLPLGSNNNISGELPPEIGDFSDLGYLSIRGNNIEGSIPPELGNLANLTSIDFASHSITGSIPPEIGNLTNLTSLSITGNNLSGSIPPEIGNLTELTEITIVATEITGSIPSEIGNLTNLERIWLQSTQLTGNIPAEIGNLSQLVSFQAGGNNLQGSIPPEIGNCTNLSYLSLRNNQLSGSIPGELGNLSNLISVDFGNNQLSGHIPSEFGNMISLNTIKLDNNQLSGHIPFELGNSSSLNNIYLSNNQLTGSIPSSFGNILSLNRLIIDNNQLTGTIPSELGNLPYLSTLNLNENQLTGSIPSELGNLSNLSTLDLSGNQLTGTIPSEFENTNLFSLLLDNNQLSGSIPVEFGNLSNIYELRLNNNQLTGVIPPELGNANMLLNSLYLNNNQLTGSIPTELSSINYLYELNLSNNQLIGDIPSELSYLTLLRELDLSNNQLSGLLPAALVNLSNLDQLSLANNELSGCFPSEYTSFCDNYILLDFTGNPDLPFEGDFQFFCVFGTCSSSVLDGQIIFDENPNCSKDSTEFGLQNWMVKADSEFGPLYGISDENGYYRIYTIPGEYELELIPPPGPYWDESCTETQIINVLDVQTTDTLDFFPSALIDCPFMTADISTPFLRRCFDNTYAVSYCNQGTLTAESAYIEIQFDQLINVQSASIPISTQVDNTLVFELGDIGPNQCETFQIYIDVSCDAILDQTLCAIAHIYPDSICEDTSPEWSGATVEVEGACNGDQVTFTIKNIGDGNMLENESYIVVEDGLILLSAPTPFILNSLEEFDINFPANGSTYMCRARQVDNHPFRSMPTAFVEGCGTNEEGGFSTGFVTQFPEDDNAPFVSIDCQETIGAFDPNDKRGYPKGYRWQHFIDKGQDIEYHIRFQNTGTDTAFTVVVQDIISPHLDMTTFVRGSSSHPYSVDILGGDTLLFIFEDILLVDSFANEPASHGFVKFKMSQKEDLPLGTRIENTAGIFFDFNEAVITNTTWHILGEDFIINSINDPFISNLKVALMPNPMIDQSCFQLSGIDFKNAQLILYNMIGMPLRRETFIGDKLWINKENLPAGIYLFEILVDGRKGLVGKLVIQ